MIEKIFHLNNYKKLTDSPSFYNCRYPNYIFNFLLIFTAILVILVLTVPVFKIKAVSVTQVNKNKITNNITIFVLDTNIDKNYIKNNQLPVTGKIGHGTLVSYIIKKEAPGSHIIPHDVGNKHGGVDIGKYLSGLERIIKYSINNPDKKILVNISLAISEYDVIHHQLIKKLFNQGVGIIAAAGNDNSRQQIYPAALSPAVIAVADATTKNKTDYSNFGEYIDISAPGQTKIVINNYLSWVGSYKSLKIEGTSFAAPRVTGLTARMLNLNPTLKIEEVISIIKKTADPIQDFRFEKGLLGAGVINKDKAVAYVDSRSWLEKYRKYIFMSGILLLSLLIFIYRKGIVGFFLFLLSLLVIGPVILIIIGQLQLNYLTIYHIIQSAFPGLYGIIILISSFLILYKTSGWRIFALILDHLILLVILMTAGLLAAPAGKSLTIIYTAGHGLFILLLISIEKFILRKISQNTDPQQLKSYLFSNSNKIIKKAVNRLIETNNLSGLITFSGNDRHTLDLITRTFAKSFLENKSRKNIKKLSPKLDKILEVLSQTKAPNQELVNNLILLFPGSLVVDRLAFILEHEKKSITYLRRIMLITSSLGTVATELVPLLENILYNRQEMWLRYQALTTLAAVQQRSEKFKKMLLELTRDEQELIRLEARGLLEELY